MLKNAAGWIDMCQSAKHFFLPFFATPDEGGSQPVFGSANKFRSCGTMWSAGWHMYIRRSSRAESDLVAYAFGER
jgi:hypothetical protein